MEKTNGGIEVVTIVPSRSRVKYLMQLNKYIISIGQKRQIGGNTQENYKIIINYLCYYALIANGLDSILIILNLDMDSYFKNKFHK